MYQQVIKCCLNFTIKIITSSKLFVSHAVIIIKKINLLKNILKNTTLKKILIINKYKKYKFLGVIYITEKIHKNQGFIKLYGMMITLSNCIQ